MAMREDVVALRSDGWLIDLTDADDTSFIDGATVDVDGIDEAAAPGRPTWQHLVMTTVWDQGRTARGRWRFTLSGSWATSYPVALEAAYRSQSMVPLLEALGAAGWELVTVTPSASAPAPGGRPPASGGQDHYFKRVVPPARPTEGDVAWW